jgi:8-hydroxy-5-deazaflavin:NADPH oxidoreductase
MNTDNSITTIAILGGTGKEGKGLAYRWAKAGFKVLIGSRTPEKALAAANELNARLGKLGSINGAANFEAAEKAEVIVMTVPYSAHRTTLEDLKKVINGKLLVDVTVPLVPPKVARVQMPPAGSAAQEAREILGESVSICTAFQNISYEHLLGEQPVNCDVLVTGTSPEARGETIKLVEAIGLNAWDAGPIENSVVVEGLTSVLIGINKKYGSTNAGIKISGVEKRK